MAETSVLVIEDDRAVRETLVDALVFDGMSAVGAEDGRQALDVLSQRHPEVIVLDLTMPTMDGWEFRRLHRRLYQDGQDVRLIVISATPDPRLDEIGPDAYLKKPFDLDAFLEIVRGLVRQRRELAS
jgi:two-component system response regulator MprA